MKKQLLWFFGLMLSASTLFLTNCNSDKCKDVDCVNGTCNETDGSCNCDAGYEYDAGGKCTVLTRSKLDGDYSTTEKCDTDPTAQDYSITVKTDATNVVEIDFLNFFNSFASTRVVATIGSSNSITIATQTLGAVAGGTKGIEFAGTGSYEFNAAGKAVITLSYTAIDLDTNAKTTCTSTVFTHK